MDDRAVRAARLIMTDVLAAREGERVLITADSSRTDQLERLLRAAAVDAGAVPITARFAKAHHPGAPLPEPVVAMARASNVWIELNETYILGTAAHFAAEEVGLRRFYSLSGMTIADLIDLELEVDREALVGLGERLAGLTSDCRDLLVTCGHGTEWRASCRGRVAAPDTTTMPLGQTHIAPLADSIAGTLVFDGSAYPPESLGVLRGTIAVEFSAGTSRVVSSGRESELLKAWQASLDEPAIHRLSHFSYGYHPRVPFPTGRLVKDERVFGALCIGFGPDQPYNCHGDLTILDATVVIDGTVIQERGGYVEPGLRELAKSLGAPGY